MTKLGIMLGLVACLGPFVLVSDADARSRRGGGRQAYTSYQAHGPNQARQFRPRSVIVPMMLLGGGSGYAVCVLYEGGWFCTPAR